MEPLLKKCHYYANEKNSLENVRYCFSCQIKSFKLKNAVPFYLQRHYANGKQQASAATELRKNTNTLYFGFL